MNQLKVDLALAKADIDSIREAIDEVNTHVEHGRHLPFAGKTKATPDLAFVLGVRTVHMHFWRVVFDLK